MTPRLLFALLATVTAGHALAALPAGPPGAQQRLDAVRAEARAAEAEAERLAEAANRATGEAEAAAAERRALAAEIEASSANLAALQVETRTLSQEIAAARTAFAKAAAPASSLMAGLATLSQRPPLLTLADSGSIDEFIRLQSLVAATAPVIEARTADIRARMARLASLDAALADRRAAAEAERERLDGRRVALASFEEAQRRTADSLGRAASGADRSALAAEERVGELADAATREGFAADIAQALGTYAPAPPRPASVRREPADGVRAPFAYRLPASGRVTQGVGSLTLDGVRARGLVVAAPRGAAVAVPADGTVVFAGPLRRRDGVVVIDHGDGWRSLLTGVRTGFERGDSVAAGAALGTALGPVGVELWEGRTPRSPALIARSSTMR